MKFDGLMQRATRVLPGRMLILVLLAATGCGREAPSFVERPPIKGHSREVTSVAFAPDGKSLASRSADSIRLWDVAKGAEIRSMPGDGSDFGSVVFSPDGRRLASEEVGKGAVVWDLTGDHEPAHYSLPPGKTVSASPKTRGWGLAFSPDGKLLIGGGSHEGDTGLLSVWDTTNQAVSELPSTKRPITTVAFSPDGKTIGSGTMDGRIILFDLATRRKSVAIEANRSYLAPVVFTLDGRQIASADEARLVRLWDVKTGKSGIIFKGHIKAVLSIAFHPNGRTMVSGDSGGTIFVWDIPSGKALTRLEPKDHGKVWSLAYSPDGKILASGGEDHLIHFWDVSGETSSVSP